MTRAFQRAYVALLTRAQLRADFLEDAQALADFDLSERELAALGGIGAEALERFARSLVAKRWRALQGCVPLTLRICPSLPTLHRQWAEGSPDPGHEAQFSPGTHEGHRALEALRRALHTEELAPPYAADLFTFEVLQAGARRDGRPRTFAARYRVHEIAEAVRAGTPPIDPDVQALRYRISASKTEWKRR